MLIKKFVAATMNEALALVKTELGEDAVILQSRKLDKGGLRSIGGKGQVEVTAATPDRHPLPKPGTTRPVRFGSRFGSKAAPVRKLPETLAPPPALLGIREYAQQTGAAPESGFRETLLSTLTPAPPVVKSGAAGADPVPETGRQEDESMFELRTEIETLKGSIRDLAARLARQDPARSEDGLDPYRESLRQNGCSLETVVEVVDELAGRLKPSDLDNPELVESRLHEVIAARFHIASLEDSLAARQHPSLIAVVGPTGVGKTTTLAKMATNFDVFGRRKVAMISTDTYRVAAVEQLRTFAGIAGLPLDVVYRAEELPAAIERYRNYDLLLLDTAGRSQNDEEALEELFEFIEYAQPVRTLLTLSANTRTDDQREVIQKYRRLRFTDIVLTKLDEVSNAGHLIDMASITGDIPWVYMTTGQAVPDDIVPADPSLIAAMVIRREYFLHLRTNGFQVTSE